MEKINPTNVSSNYLAEVLGMTRHGVSKLYAAGVLTQNGIARGKYNLYDAVPAYLNYLRENNGETADVLLKRQQELKLRLQNDKTEAGLVNVSDAAQVFALAISIFRSVHEEVFEGIAAELAKTDKPHEVITILKDRFNQVGQAANDGLAEIESLEKNER